MLRYLSYNIVFQEVPNELTLAINLSNCPNRCKGCHSPYLQENKGEYLDEKAIGTLLTKYGNAITCVCFMGGDGEPQEIEKLSCFIRTATKTQIKTAWYSGKPNLPNNFNPFYFDYLKLGPYIEHLGGLDSPTTNQRFYKIVSGKFVDISSNFIKTLNSQQSIN